MSPQTQTIIKTTPQHQDSGKKRISVPVLLLYIFAILFVAYIVYFFILNGPKDAPLAIMKKRIPDFPWTVWETVLYAHIATGSMALLIGPFQFLKFSHIRHKKLHRALGAAYAGSIFLSIPMSLYLSLYASGGLVAGISFSVLAAAWFTTTFLGLKKALKRDITAHKEWMLRSYAVTWVFVMFRVELPIYQILFHEIGIASPLAVWTGLIGNLWFAQRRIRRNRNRNQTHNLHR